MGQGVNSKRKEGLFQARSLSLTGLGKDSTKQIASSFGGTERVHGTDYHIDVDQKTLDF